MYNCDFLFHCSSSYVHGKCVSETDSLGVGKKVKKQVFLPFLSCHPHVVFSVCCVFSGHVSGRRFTPTATQHFDLLHKAWKYSFCCFNCFLTVATASRRTSTSRTASVTWSLTQSSVQPCAKSLTQD